MIPTFAQLNLLNFALDGYPDGVNVEEDGKLHKEFVAAGFQPLGKIPVLKVTHKSDTVYIPTIPVGLSKK